LIPKKRLLGAREVTYMKKPYQEPKLQQIGSIPELTLATHHGYHLDANFSTGTSLTDLTVS
jgi:hypothetical protein